MTFAPVLSLLQQTGAHRTCTRDLPQKRHGLETLGCYTRPMKRALNRVPTLVLGPVAVLLFAAGPSVQAIMAGQSPDSPATRVNPNSDSTYSGVGSVLVNGSPLSGVVIAGQFVLTAAHVVSGLVAAPIGGTVSYEFGTIGGGMVASDARFASWLQSTTEGTFGKAARVHQREAGRVEAAG